MGAYYYHHETTDYSGSQITSSVTGVTIGTIDITDEGTITDLNVMIDLSSDYYEQLQWSSLTLLSPYGTSIYLAGGNQVSGSWGGNAGATLYNTIFDDEASTNIYEGTSPFIGSFIPVQSLNQLDGETITGTWELIYYSKQPNQTTIDWSLQIEIDNSTPTAPTNFGTEYSGSQITTSSIGVTIGTIDITDEGTITDLNVMIDLSSDYYEQLQWSSLTLLSPYGTSIYLAGGNQVSGSWAGVDGSDLYNTLIDDEASLSIYNGYPPFVGTHLPYNQLNELNGQSITGTWELIYYSKQPNQTTIDWSLLISTDDSNPLPVPDFGTEYVGSQINTSASGVASGTLNVSSSETIENLNVNINLSSDYYEHLQWISLTLISPTSTSVLIGAGTQVSGSW
jgi:hypothetical protein